MKSLTTFTNGGCPISGGPGISVCDVPVLGSAVSGQAVATYLPAQRRVWNRAAHLAVTRPTTALKQAAKADFGIPNGTMRARSSALERSP